MKTLLLLFLVLQSIYAVDNGYRVENSLKKESTDILMESEVKKLLEIVGKDEGNIKDRKKLMRHYMALNDKDMVKTMATEIFKKVPEEPETMAFLKKHHIAPDPINPKRHTNPEHHKYDAYMTLKMYAGHNEYGLFLHLFRIMEKKDLSFPRDILFFAINAAIETKDYKLAYRIVKNYDFPKTKNYKRFVNLIDKKVKSF